MTILKSIFILSFLLIGKCNEPSNEVVFKVDETIIGKLNNGSLTVLDSFRFKQDLKVDFGFFRDYLPSGWDWDGEEKFYQLFENEIDSKKKFMIYLLANNDAEIGIIKLASFENDSIILNHPLRQFNLKKPEKFELVVLKKGNVYFTDAMYGDKVIPNFNINERKFTKVE